MEEEKVRKIEREVLKHHNKYSKIMPEPCDICIKMAINLTEREIDLGYRTRLSKLGYRITKLENLVKLKKIYKKLVK